MQIKLEFRKSATTEPLATCFADARITNTGGIIVYSVDASNFATSGSPSVPPNVNKSMKFHPSGYRKNKKWENIHGDWYISKEDVEKIKILPKKEIKERPMKKFDLVVSVEAKTLAGARAILLNGLDDNRIEIQQH